MSLVFDEYGRPFIILREQQQQARIKVIVICNLLYSCALIYVGKADCFQK